MDRSQSLFESGTIYKFNGISIVTHPCLVTHKEVKVKRSWRERLFTLPWTPLQKTKTLYHTVPSTEIIMCHDMIVCHPMMLLKLKAQLEKII